MTTKRMASIEATLESVENARECLVDIVQILESASHALREFNPRIAANMKSYMIPHLKAWYATGGFKGGGDRLNDVIEALEDAMREAEDAEDE